MHSSQQFIQNWAVKTENKVSSSVADKNMLLMIPVSGEWPNWIGYSNSDNHFVQQVKHLGVWAVTGAGHIRFHFSQPRTESYGHSGHLES